MKKKRIMARICAFVLAASFIAAEAMPASAASTAEDSSAWAMTPVEDVQPETAEDSSAQTMTPVEDVQPETLEEPETVRNTEWKPEARILDGTDEEPETSGRIKTEPEIPNGTELPNNTEEQLGIAPAPQVEEEQKPAPSGLEKKDGLVYMDGVLYTGCYMDAANILYNVSSGVAEPVNGMVNAGTSYYDCQKKETLTLPKQTLFVTGKPYAGYYIGSDGIFYLISSESTEPVTGTVKQGVSYYNCLESKTITLPKQTLYVKGKVYSGYFLSGKNKMYYVKKGTSTLKTGNIKANTKYYSYSAKDTRKLSKNTLYIKGNVYSGYFLSKKNKMYYVKKGTSTLKTGSIKAGAKYYSYNAGKTHRLSKQTLYVKGKIYSGYYTGSKNKMYRAKKGSLTLVTGTLDTGTKYFSCNARKTKKLSKPTLYVKGKVYSGYYLDKANKMHHVDKGTCSLVNTTLNAATRYYSYHAGKTLALPAATVYVNGKAMEGMSPESLAVLQRAQAIVTSITNDSMSMEQKLRACFDYVKTYREGRPRTPNYTGMDWPVIYANDIFVNGFGNCCSYAAAFAYMAKAIGYEEVYCCNDSGHGWAEIDGLIYDPEWSMHHDVYSYYALSYDTKTDVDYKGNIAARLPWMHVKI